MMNYPGTKMYKVSKYNYCNTKNGCILETYVIINVWEALLLSSTYHIIVLYKILCIYNPQLMETFPLYTSMKYMVTPGNRNFYQGISYNYNTFFLYTCIFFIILCISNEKEAAVYFIDIITDRSKTWLLNSAIHQQVP